MNRETLLRVAMEAVRTVPEVVQYLSADTLAALKGGAGSGNFGHAGRPGEVGGSAPEGTMRISDFNDKDITANINRICDKLGFPPEKVFASKSISSVLGSYNTVTGDITLSPMALGGQMEGVLSHEIAHHNFENLQEDDWKQPLRGTSQEILDATSQYMDYDERTEYEDNYRIAIQELGGVSEYSNLFWTRETRDNKKLFELAVNETFAEIARLYAVGKEDEIPPVWKDVYNKVYK